MNYSTRKRDYIIEQIANQFEDTYFWPRQLGAALSCMTRYDDKEHQFAGIDFTLTSSKGTINFDSKVKYYNCLNEVLQTPGFEMSFKNSISNIQDGWLVADGNQTDYYEIIGLSCTTNNAECLSSVDQITGMDILWLNKKELVSYIEQYSTLEELKQDAKTLRECFDVGQCYDIIDQLIYNRGPKDYMRYSHQKFHLKYSHTLKEQPVNLVMYRNALEALRGTRHFVVTRDWVKNEVQPSKIIA